MCEESDIPRIGSGGPAGTADQTERVRKAALLRETTERRATDEASMLGIVCTTVVCVTPVLILLRRLDPKDSAWESMRDYQQLSFG